MPSRGFYNPEMQLGRKRGENRARVNARPYEMPYCVVLRPLDQIDFAWS
jgi:hypothetical protein